LATAFGGAWVLEGTAVYLIFSELLELLLDFLAGALACDLFGF